MSQAKNRDPLFGEPASAKSDHTRRARFQRPTDKAFGQWHLERLAVAAARLARFLEPLEIVPAHRDNSVDAPKSPGLKLLHMPRLNAVALIAANSRQDLKFLPLGGFRMLCAKKFLRVLLRNEVWHTCASGTSFTV
jgi:hypothetical protein